MKSLVKTQLIVNFFNLNLLRADKNKFKRFGILLAMIISLLPMYVFYIVGLYKLYSESAKIGINFFDVYLSSVYIANQLMILIFGVFMTYYFLYTQKDLELLLTLPYKPYHILLSKIAVLYINFMIFPTIFVMMPVYILNLIYTPFFLIKAVNSFLTILTMPILPILVSVIISFLISFIPVRGFAKTLVQLLIGMAFIFIVFSIQLFLIPTSKSFDVIDFTKTKLMYILRLKTFVIGSGFGIDTFIKSGIYSIISQLYNIILNSICFFAILFISNQLYIKPIQKGDFAKSNHVKSKRGDVLARKRLTSSLFISYFIKELNVFIKEPVLFLNSLGGYITLPFLLLFYKILGTKDKEFAKMIDQIITFSKDRALVFSSIIAIILAFFSIGSLFSCIYSKDGKRLWIERMLPVGAHTIFLYKFIFAFLITSVFNIALIALVEVIFKLGAMPIALCFVLSEILIFINGMIGIIIDVKRPKLNWNSMTEAVKQNMNVMIQMGITSIIFLLNGFIIYLMLKLTNESILSYLLLIILNLIISYILVLLAKRSSKAFENINI